MMGGDPTPRVFGFLAFLAAGIVAYYVIEASRLDESNGRAVAIARQHHPRAQGPTLEEALRREHDLDADDAILWGALPQEGSATLPRVRATLERGGQTYDYRFDVDTKTGLVHPANPRARELLVRLIEAE